MAIIKPANVAPDTLPRIRGQVITYQHRGQWIMASWPKKRGPNTHQKVQYLSKQWTYAAKMAANPEPKSYDTAVFLSQGTSWVPRDILMMAAYGKLYEIVLPDGTVAPQAYHGPPLPQPSGIPNVLQWQPNQVNGVIQEPASTSAYAFKGVTITPDISMLLYAASVCLTPVNGATYKVICAALNASNVIQSIQDGVAEVITGTTKKIYTLECSATLDAGVKYAVMIGRTDGANNYALPISGGTNSGFIMPVGTQGYSRLAQNTPAAGHTVEVGTPGFAMSLLFDF